MSFAHWLPWLWLWLLQSAAARQAQFCNPADDCLAIDADALQTSTLQISASLKLRAGWVAIGSGTQMADAHMIVVHLNAARDGLTVSARTTATRHEPPALAERLADRLTYDAVKVGDYWQANISCGACVVGDGRVWIWAVNDDQSIATNEFDAPLQLHTDFGRFQLDDGSMRDDIASDDRATYGVAALKSHVGSHDDGPNAGRAGGHKLFIVHGALMTIAFLVLFPVGSLAIRWPATTAFKRHWLIQATAASLVLLSAILALQRGLRKRSLLESFLMPHHGLGMVITLLVLAQAGLGYKHHTDFLRIRRRTGFSNAHVWAGRGALLPLGFVNVAYGASFHNRLLGSTFATWLAVLAVGTLWAGVWAWVLRRRSQWLRVGHVVPPSAGLSGGPVSAARKDEDDDEAAELFELGSDHEHSDSDDENDTKHKERRDRLVARQA